MACTLISERVYQSAKNANGSVVEKLKTHFINQIGAHIAIHGLNKALEQNLGEHVKRMGCYFKEQIKDIVARSPMHKEVRGEGLLLYLKLNKKVFPINLLFEEFVEFLMSSYYLEQGKVLFLNSRLTPSLAIEQKEVQMLCNRIQITLEKQNRLLLFFFCLRQIMHIHTLCFLQKIRERFSR